MTRVLPLHLLLRQTAQNAVYTESAALKRLPIVLNIQHEQPYACIRHDRLGQTLLLYSICSFNFLMSQ